MSDKRDAYVHTRVTQKEMQVIDALARRLRRTRSDTMRVLALEKAEAMGLLWRATAAPLAADEQTEVKYE